MGGKTIRSERLRRLWREPRTRILFWATLVALIFGVLDLGDPIERTLYLARTSLTRHRASGDIVIAGIDDRTLAAVRQNPVPRHVYAQLADNLRELGAHRVFFDFAFPPTRDRKDDTAFAQALARMNGRATIAIRFVIDPATKVRTDIFPADIFRKKAQLANINVQYMAHGTVWNVPYALNYGGRPYPSFAAALARTAGPADEMFPIDYSINPASIPLVSAADVLNKRVPKRAIGGKDVVVAASSLQLGDEYLMPGRGPMAGVYVQVLGAETLKAGRPVTPAWPLPLLTAILASAFCMFRRRSDHAIVVAIGTSALLLFVPAILEAHHIYVTIVPALVLLVGALGVYSWQRFRRSYRDRAIINLVSGLPNLNALREVEAPSAASLIAARVQNYAQVCAALKTDEERTLAEQVASRLTVGESAVTVYQGDEGIFAWFAPAQVGLEEHLSALHALFRSPVVVAGNRVDLTITFGVDSSADRSIASRLGGALAAADEAAAESRKWKHYDPGTGEDATWRLSILSQLDAAIGAGDLWVAYQPKFDVKTKLVVGAEALVRWTHPTKGPISPMEFIPAAEQSGRIEKLTEFVLDRAIRAASLAVQRNPSFNMSVNLSPKLLGTFPLESRVVELLAAYGLPATCLTLEVTETAALARGAADLEPLHALCRRGVRISIDDYGTGLSTLDYIKRLPATEIKIDKSFVQAVGKSQSDRLMVHSTIQLAHSLGHKVVAEGVEDLSTFEALAAMGCDIVQGFYFAKPMSFRDLTPLIPGWRKTDAA